jgi:hypothetical protein
MRETMWAGRGMAFYLLLLRIRAIFAHTISDSSPRAET